MDKKYKILTMDIKDNKESHILNFVGTDDTLDRDEEILTHAGWDLKNYKKNPVMLWAHDYRSLPIGRALSVRASKEEGLIFKIEFTKEEINPFGHTVYKLYRGGFLKAVSVGFKADRKKNEFDKETGIVIVNKKELWELSAVPVPANPNALLQDSAKSAFDSKLLNQDEYENFMKVYADFQEAQKELDIYAKNKKVIEFDESELDKKNKEGIDKDLKIDNNTYEHFLSIEALKGDHGSPRLNSDLVDKFTNIFKE